MIRKTAALACVFLLLGVARTAPAADAAQLRGAARAGALDALLKKVRALKTGDKSVGEILDGIAAPVTWEAVLGGAEQETPARYYATGECEVAVRIAADRLRANLRKVFQAHAPDAKADAESLKIPTSHLVASGTFIEPRSWRQPEKLVYGPPQRLDGWSDVDALGRAKVEQAALAEAGKALRARLAEVLKGLADAETLVAFLVEDTIPQSKAFLAGGVVEVRMRVKAKESLARLRERIQSMTPEKRPLSRKALAALSERLDGRTIEVAGYAATKGKPVAPDRLFKHVVLTTEAFPGFLPKPSREGGTAPGSRPETKAPETKKGNP